MTGGPGRITVRGGSWVYSRKLFTRHRLKIIGSTHLDIDAIEFVEAAPRAAPRQALEKFGHSEVVQTVRTVEYHTLHA